MEWRRRRVVPAAAVTTHAQPHAQQQLARDLEVERAAMEQRCRPQSFAEVQRGNPQLRGWISVELQLCCCIADVRWYCSWSSPTDQLVRKFKNSVTFTTHAKPHAQQRLPRDLEVDCAAMGQRCRPQSFGEVQRGNPQPRRWLDFW